jgi:hypothetical protein
MLIRSIIFVTVQFLVQLVFLQKINFRFEIHVTCKLWKVIYDKFRFAVGP